MHGHTTSIAWRVECVGHAAPGELIASKSLVDAFLLLSLFGLKNTHPIATVLHTYCYLCYTNYAYEISASSHILRMTINKYPVKIFQYTYYYKSSLAHTF